MQEVDEDKKAKEREYQKAYREANREQLLARNKAYYEANREQVIARNKAYSEANREQVLAQQKDYREANREQLLARKKAHYETNREQILARDKAYREANREQLLARDKAYYEANREQILAYRRAHSAAHREKPLLRGAKSRAKKYGREFAITEADIHIPEICPVLGMPLSRGKGVLQPASPSLDRIDSSKGYVTGNVRVISYRANLLKSNATIEELEFLLADARRLLSSTASER